MQTPNYVLVAKEATEVPKRKEKSNKNKIVWRIITGLILLFIALDLFLYQGIYGLGATIGLIVLYIRYTFPKVRERNRIVIWSILSVILLFSLIVKDNFLPWPLLIIAILLYLWASSSREKDTVYFPVGMQFYDDHLIIYREKKYVIWMTKYLAREYVKIFYKDVTEAKFVKYPHGALKIMGKVEILRHKYNKDGSIMEKTAFHKTLENSFGYIYTNDSPEIDFTSAIETHTPIIVTRDEYFKG